MESKKRHRSVSSNETKVGDFAAERALIEAKHRTEVLNLLKSFEFERKDIEARLRAEQEQEENEEKIQQEDFSKDGDTSEKLEEERDELQKQFEEEKEVLMCRIDELERHVISKEQDENASGGEDRTVSPDLDVSERSQQLCSDEQDSKTSEVTHSPLSQAPKGTTEELDETEATTSVIPHTATGNEEPLIENQMPKSTEKSLKSLSELENENEDLREELAGQRKLVDELRNQVAHLNHKLDDIRDVFEDEGATAAEKKDKIHGILGDCPGESSGGIFPMEDSFDEVVESSQMLSPLRSNSEMGFQIEELNLENEELKSNLLEMERKLRRTVEEYEMQSSVFQEKINTVLERMIENQAQESDRGEESSQVNRCTGDALENTINELRNVKLEKSSLEILEDYVSIVVRSYSTSQSPDVFDVNLRHQIQTLEQILDIEIFEGRMFDDEMKDEVKQVLRDKEREMIVAYAVEKLRTEIRHRTATESTLKELQKEREKDFSVYRAASEILKEHLGISGTAEDTDDLEKALGGYYSGKQLKAGEENPEEGTNSADIDALKAEKEELEKGMEELQYVFEKERQEWLNKLPSASQGGPEELNEKDTVIKKLRAQMIVMEQVLNTERFHLSRLYYLEMKEELDVSLKTYHAQHSGKQESDRITEAWRHHAEVGELYQKILDKDIEAIERIKGQIEGEKEEPETSSLLEAASEEKLNEETLRLDTQLPAMLELVELQRKRCREHKAVTLILEQAVNAVEIAVQEHDSLLVSGTFLQRKSSWSSNEENQDDETIHKPSSLSPRISEAFEEEKGMENVSGMKPHKDSISSKEALEKALGELLENLLNEQTDQNDPDAESGPSDSDLSEIGSSSDKDVPSEDEAVANEDEAVANEDEAVTNEDEVVANEEGSKTGSPQGSLSEVETELDREPENDSEDENKTTESPVPIIYKLSPNIEKVLSLEAFNMSRLLRREYVDEIRKGRRKIGRLQAHNAENNGELLAKYQERVGLLLGRTDFGESGERGDDFPERQRLTATPSHDSGIVDFEAEKDNVVKKYKELLENARKDLNHAHESEMNNEIMEMKRNLKEKENDLKELEEKYSALDDDRKALLGRIKETGDSGNGSNSHADLQREENCYATKVEPDFRSPLSAESCTRTDQRLSEKSPDSAAGDESKISPLCTGLRQEQETGSDLDGGDFPEVSLDTDAGSDGIEGDRKVLSEENEKLQQKVNALEKDMERKEMEYEVENRGKQKEVDELQRKLLDGTGGEDVLQDLQEKLNGATEEGKKLKARCYELEKSNELGRSGEEDGQNGNLAKELEIFKAENETLENENKLKREKINDLQVKLVQGTDGEEILKDLQRDMDELSDKNKMLKKKCQEKEIEELVEKKPLSEDNLTEVVGQLKQENETLGLANQDLCAKVEELRKNLVEGTGSEALLEELENEVRDLKTVNKELEKRCCDLEENEKAPVKSGDKEMAKWQKELNKEKEKLILDNKNKENEITELQRKLLEGSGGEEVLENLQEKTRELKEKNECLEKQCQELESTCDELKSEQQSDRNMEKELSEVREENTSLLKENKSKDAEVRELENALVQGNGGEEMLQKLQAKIQGIEENNKELEKQCRGLNNTSDELGKKNNDLTSENRKLGKEIERIKEEDDYLERESQAKSDEISKLQEKLLDGTGGEEILQDLRDKVKDVDEKNKELRKKCSEMEDREEMSNDEGEVNKENKKELGRLKNQNERLLQDRESKEKEISQLQKKLLEGNGEEDVLENIQDQLKELTAKNDTLEADCYNLEDENEKLRGEKHKMDEEANETAKLREENDNLTDRNKAKDDEIRELQRKLVGGTGGEEILEELQDKIKEAEEDNRVLEKECKELKNTSEELWKKENEVTRDNKKLAKEVERIKKENDYLERESQAKGDKISKLQEKLLDGTGGEEILQELRDKVKDLEEKNKEMRKKCSEMEDREEMLNDESEVNKENKKELGRLKHQNERLLQDRESKEKEISELQKKLLEGNGEDVLENIQNQLKELTAINDTLEANCYNLEDENEKLRGEKDKMDKEANETAKLREENGNLVDRNKAKDDEIRELQRKLVGGTGGEEILQELQDKIKEAEESNRALEKECKELKNTSEELGKKENEVTRENKILDKEVERIKKENDYLERESEAKGDEISKLQEKLLDGTGGEEILQDLRDKVKDLEEKNKEMRKKCSEMEEEMSNDEGEVNKENKKELGRLKNQNERLLQDRESKEKEISELQKKLLEGNGEDVLENIQDQLKELTAKNDTLEANCYNLEDENENLRGEKGKMDEEANETAKLREENDTLVGRNKVKDDEIRELQRKLVGGTGGEEILQELQDKIKEADENNRALEKECKELKNTSEELGKKENEGTRENKKLAKEVERIKKENDYLERESQAKGNEISKLQEKLLDGTGGEEILQDLRGKVKDLEEKSKEMRKKCSEMEDEMLNDEGEVNKENKKELGRLKNQNERLLQDRESKEKEISELQKKLLEGSGEDVLENIQHQLKELTAKNDTLEANCYNLEDENEKLRGEKGKMDKEVNETAKLREENDNLADRNKAKDDEIRELQRKLVGGTGGEEILQELQDKIKEAEENNRALEKECKELKNTSEELGKKENEVTRENKKLAKEVERIKKENDYLERESQAKGDEISKLQEKLLDGTGGEEILQDLRGKVKDLEEKNKEMRKKCSEMEDREEMLKDEGEVNKENKKELGRLKNQNERLLQDRESKEKEISKLQKKLLEGNGEDVLENIQDQLKELTAKNDTLEANCYNLEDENEKLRGEKGKMDEEANETAKLREENDNLTDRNKAKDDEIRELQRKLVGGTGGEEILQELQDKIKEAEENNGALEKECKELKNTSEELGKKENEVTKENKILAKEVERIKKENDYLERESRAKGDEISKLQEKLLDGTGGEEILQDLRDKVKDLEEKNKEMRKKCSEMEDEMLNDDQVQANKENEAELAEIRNKMNMIALENNEKDDEIADLQKKLLDGSGAEDLLAKLQNQIKDLKKKNEKLEADCHDLENVNKRLKKDEDERVDTIGAISKLREENEKLTSENETKDNEISDLQTRLVSGTGGEEILQQLQDELKMSKEKNNQLEKKCKGLETTNESLVNKDGDQGDFPGYLAKSNKVDEMRTINEKIVPKLQAPLESVEDEQLEEGTNYPEDVGATVKEPGVGRGKHSSRQMDKLKSEAQKLLLENKEKRDEISELQKKLFEGTGEGDVLQKLQDEIKQLKDENEILQTNCHDLEDENEKLEDDRMRLQHEMNETSRLRKEKEVLVAENEEKFNEVCELQRKLVEGTGVDEIVQQLQDELKNLGEKNKELEKQCENTNKLVKEDDKPLKREIAQMEYMNEQLENENEMKNEEVNRLQKKLVEGTGSEDILQELQDQVKELEKTNKELKRTLNDLQTREETAEKSGGESERMREHGRRRKKMDRLERENKDQGDEIINLQKRLLSGNDGENVLEELQGKLKNSKDQNNNLQALCRDFEDIIETLRNEDGGSKERRRTMSAPKKDREIAKLRKNVRALEKEKKCQEEIFELQNKLLERTGGEEILAKLQDGLKDSEEKVDLRRKNEKLSKTKDAERRRPRANLKKKISSGDGVADKKDKKISPAYETLPSYDECVELIPKITEERDHWKDKYNSLRKKVGEQFVDIIPEVWMEETQLEKERDDTLIKISELEKEIAEKETPLLKTMAEKERIERELKDIKGQLQDNTEQFEYIRDLKDQEERLEEKETKLRQCLRDLKSKCAEDNDEEISSDQEERQEILNDLYEEVKNLPADTTDEHKQKHQNGLHAMLNEKDDLQKEITKLEKAIEELQRGSSSGVANTSEPSRSASQNLGNSEEQGSEKLSVHNELEEISCEVSKLQSSLEASSGSNIREVSDLFSVLKEKSKIEDELSEANKALSQLGKREYENLAKERGKQEKVAKKLMELSREKERHEKEFQELDVLVKAKEDDLLSYFKSEKEKEDLPKRKTVSIEQKLEQKPEQTEFSSSDETLDGSAEEQEQLSPKDLLLTSETLGSLIQKRSSLAVRLESLGKEITAQSLKVEKSLLGVKEEPTGELTPAYSDSSLDDLSQSQLSLFDDYNMIDELSLATGVVREERVRRKSSRKAPMSKLLKEKIGLDKKHKGLEGKILVQNAKFKNALREGKDTAKAQEKLLKCVEERKQIEDELATVVGKIDECKNLGDEFTAGQGKLGKKRGSSGSLGRRRKSQDKTGGKSLSKNDKRRLLSQRESLVKQLENVKRKVEDLSLEMDGDAFEGLPEMAEAGDVGQRVEKLRELIIREAELKQNLEGVAKNEEQTDEERLKVAGASYRGVLDVLRKEKEKKEGMLAKLERDIEAGETFKSDGKDENVSQKKIKALKEKIESALRELEIEKQNIKEELLDSEELLDTEELLYTIDNEGATSRDKEEVLKNNIAELAKQKEQLEKALVEESLQESLQTEPTKNEQDPEQVFKDYQQFIKLKTEEESLGAALEEINRKLLTRKGWATSGEKEHVPGEGQDDDNNLAQSYGEILQRMADENLNMADLIREFEVTQEALSREREITGELLELIKSRVGNELLEALTVDGLSSPLLETTDLDSTGSSEYLEVASKIEHDSVTVAEIITDYKKMNEQAQKENEKIFSMLELLKSKVDEDLFDAIVNEEATGLGDSKKSEISKILENNKTLFEQIVAKEKDGNENHEKLVKCLEEENEKLKMELEDAKDGNEENEGMKDELVNLGEEVKRITAQLEAEKEQKGELERSSKDLQELEKESASLKEMFANLGKENESIYAKHEDVTKKHEQTENNLKDMKEEKDQLIEEMEQQIIQLTSKLEEMELRMKKDVQLESENLKELKETFEGKPAEVEEKKVTFKQEQVEEPITNEIRNEQESLQEIPKQLEEIFQQDQDRSSEINFAEENLAVLEKENVELVSKLDEADKVKEGMRNELKLNEEIGEDNKLIREKMDILQKQNEEIVCELNNEKETNKEIVEELKCLAEVQEENASMKEILEELEKENNEIIPSLDDLKRVNKELEDEVEYLRKEKADLESMQSKWSNMENNEERMKQELDELKNEKSQLEDYVENVLKRNASGGLKKALEDYSEELKEMNEAQESLARECESLKELKRIVGEKMDILQKQNEEIVCELNNEKETNKEIAEELKCLGEVKEENASMKEILEGLEKENNEIIPSLDDLKRVNKELEDEVEYLRKEKADLQSMQSKWSNMENNEERLKHELDELKNEKSQLEDYMENVLKRNASGGLQKALEDYNEELKEMNEARESLARECESLKELKRTVGEKMDILQKQNEEIVCELNNEKKMNKEIAEELKCLGEVQEENASMKEILEKLEKENNEIIPSLDGLKRVNKELEDEIEYLRKEKADLESMQNKWSNVENNEERLKQELDELKNEKSQLEEYMENVLKRNASGGLKKALEDYTEEIKDVNEAKESLARECESLKELKGTVGEKMDILQKQNEEIVCELNNVKETNKEIAEELKCLGEVREENASMKEILEELEKENNEIIPSLDDLKRVNKELEDEVEYLRKEKADLESMQNKWSNMENNEERMKQELDELKNEKSQLEDYMENVLKRNASGGLKKALEDYNEELKDVNEAKESLARECESLKELKRTVGETLTENLLGLFKEQGDILEDTCYVPRCLESISTHQVTLAKVLENYEKDGDTMENRLGGKQSCSALDEEQASGNSKTSKQNKSEEESDDIHDDGDDSFPPKVNGFKEKIDEGEEGKGLQSDDEEELSFEHHDIEPLNMKGEYLELLRKVMEHQREIEEAEGILQEQRNQHKMEKEQLESRLNEEKNGMLYQIECERNSMAMAMQNLINEIVRLKEERKEIRKSNRTEREKMETAFENERVEFYSKDEMGKMEMKEKVEKSFLEFSQKEKGMMEEKENELKEEVLKLTSERKEMAVRLKEMERELESRRSVENNSTDQFQEIGEKEEKERREKIRNEFEEKLKQEKTKFQETLVSLRQEIDGLQLERSRANLVEFSQNNTQYSQNISRAPNVEDIRHTVPDLSIYERMESDFRAKIHSEKLSLENRIKELRREKEELHEQKRELKSSMRNQRLEMCKKHEKEKEELAEKYRNELKSKQNQTEANTIARSFSDYQTFYELRRALGEKEAKIRRYEVFFKELNQEASTFQQDTDVTEE